MRMSIFIYIYETIAGWSCLRFLLLLTCASYKKIALEIYLKYTFAFVTTYHITHQFNATSA